MAFKIWENKAKKQLKPELFAKDAEALAIRISGDASASRGTMNKTSQIRKFYDEVIRFQNEVMQNPNDFANNLPYFKMLNAKAAYASGRKLISEGFRGFINEAVIEVNDYEDFKAFVGYFEAFMGYYKYYDEKNINERAGGRR